MSMCQVFGEHVTAHKQQPKLMPCPLAAWITTKFQPSYANKLIKIQDVLKQRTLQTLTRAVGVGLHSGQRVELCLRPAPPDTGVVFRRIDLSHPVDIPVCATAVTDTRLASTISANGVKVLTVEHLMSACSGLGIDNLYVDITAEEVPILDGSSASFVFLLQSAGIVLQDAPKRFIRVLSEVSVMEGEAEQRKWAKLSPYHGYKLSFEIDFQHPAVDATGQRVDRMMAILRRILRLISPRPTMCPKCGDWMPQVEWQYVAHGVARFRHVCQGCHHISVMWE